jgi:hypothetical protein
MHQALGLLLGESEDLFRLLAERDLDRGRELFPGRTAALQLGAQQFHGHVGPIEKLARGLFAFFEQTEQEMLGGDDLAPLLTGFVTGQEQNPLRLLGELFEH